MTGIEGERRQQREDVGREVPGQMAPHFVGVLILLEPAQLAIGVERRIVQSGRTPARDAESSESDRRPVRIHSFHLSLSPRDPGSPLPFTMTPMLFATTLLSSRSPLVYGAGCGATGSGVPALNAVDRTHYFTGRSDNFDPTLTSTNPNDARFDSESIRVSNDRRHVYISDEYGPYVYEFDRLTGERTRVFTLPAKFAATV